MLDVYANYDFYKMSFPQKRESTIKKSDFLFYARKSSQIIKMHTFDRIAELTDDIQMCCCEVAEHLCTAETRKQEHAGFTSRKTDDVSESYMSSKDIQKECDNLVIQSIHAWLAGTGLLYRGLDQ